MITLDSDPLSYAKTKPGHGTETGCNGRYETHNGEKTDPIEKEGDNTRAPLNDHACTHRDESKRGHLQCHEECTVRANIHIRA